MEKDLLVSPNKDSNHKVQSHWFPSGRGKSFKLKLPALLALTGSKQSLPQEDPDVVVVDFSKHSSDTVALEEMNLTPINNCIGSQSEDQQALIGSKEPKAPPDEEGNKESAVQSSPHTDKDLLNLDMSFSNCSLSRSRSRESFYSIRRASSVDEIEAMKVDLEKFRNRNSSTGAMNNIRANLLNSTSDSDLMRYRTISKIPQITLNFVDFKGDSFLTSPSNEKEIIAPSKLKDRTHNVTEKVTQVGHWSPVGQNVSFCLVLSRSVSFCRGMDPLGQAALRFSLFVIEDYFSAVGLQLFGVMTPLGQFYFVTFQRMKPMRQMP
eukprot:XP_004920686.1 PREDICTED: potassium voltage-gated channel subfamily H member 2-like [Xenopus tropicalis]